MCQYSLALCSYLCKVVVCILDTSDFLLKNNKQNGCYVKTQLIISPWKVLIFSIWGFVNVFNLLLFSLQPSNSLHLCVKYATPQKPFYNWPGRCCLRLLRSSNDSRAYCPNGLVPHANNIRLSYPFRFPCPNTPSYVT